MRPTPRSAGRLAAGAGRSLRARGREPTAAWFAAIGRSLGRRPATYAIVSGQVLAIVAFSYKPTFDLSSAGIPSTAESQTALKTLEKGLPPGATDPTVVLLHQPSGGALPASDVAAFGAKLKTLPGVGAVAPPKLSADHATAEYNVTLSYNPQSTVAVDVLKNQLRPGRARGRTRRHVRADRRHHRGVRRHPEGRQP